MFGHSTVMVAHEMRLPLPCDETLWNATTSTEVGRIEASLHANGVKPISFLEGLKRTLNGQEVRTNSFGRTILMAGLLSVSWHMNQRDLQVNSLGVSQALGGRDKWRGSLTRAFDLWKADFDRSLQRQTENVPTPYSDKKADNVVFESRTVLHHLAHMAMHVDIVDCQIFARAKRLLGRTIGPQDLNSAQRRMKDSWAPTAKARDATWYALRFLCAVLLPEESASHHQMRAAAGSTIRHSTTQRVMTCCSIGHGSCTLRRSSCGATASPWKDQLRRPSPPTTPSTSRSATCARICAGSAACRRPRISSPCAASTPAAPC